jgi:hypothetical protein
MSYASLMVYVDADAMPEQRVRLAASLADRFTAILMGMSALAIPPPVVADGMAMAELTDVDVELIRAKLADKGNWFRGIAGGFAGDQPLQRLSIILVATCSCEIQS